MTKTIGQLESEIKALQDELASVKGLEHLKKRSDFDSIDKLRVFDELYDYVEKLVKETIKDKCIPKDSDNYIFETVMTTFLGDKIWSILNRYVR